MPRLCLLIFFLFFVVSCVAGSPTGSRQPSPVRSPRSHFRSSSPNQCRPCSPVFNQQQQCNIPTTCGSNGRCSMDLNRCSAQYLNAHGANIDMSYWDDADAEHSESAQGHGIAFGDAIFDDEHILTPGVDFRIDPQTHRAVSLQTGKPIFTAGGDETLRAQTAQADEMAGETVEINSVAVEAVHVHIGCKNCGSKIYCERASQCTKWHRDAWCWKPKNSIAGWCKISTISTDSSGVHHIHDYCCTLA